MGSLRIAWKLSSVYPERSLSLSSVRLHRSPALSDPVSLRSLWLARCPPSPGPWLGIVIFSWSPARAPKGVSHPVSPEPILSKPAKQTVCARRGRICSSLYCEMFFFNYFTVVQVQLSAFPPHHAPHTLAISISLP